MYSDSVHKLTPPGYYYLNPDPLSLPSNLSGSWIEFQPVRCVSVCVLAAVRGTHPHNTKQTLGYQLGVLQFNHSDTIYSEVASNSTASGFSPIRLTPHPQMALISPAVNCALTNQLQIGGCHRPFLEFNWLREWLTELGKPVYSFTESQVAQSYLTPWDPMDCSLAVSSVHGIFQATPLAWVAISFPILLLDLVIYTEIWG